MGVAFPAWKPDEYQHLATNHQRSNNMLKAKDLQAAFERFMMSGQDDASVFQSMNYLLQDKIGSDRFRFEFVRPDPDAINPMIVDNGDDTLTALVTIQISITKIDSSETFGTAISQD